MIPDKIPGFADIGQGVSDISRPEIPVNWFHIFRIWSDFGYKRFYNPEQGIQSCSFTKGDIEYLVFCLLIICYLRPNLIFYCCRVLADLC